LQRQGIAGRLQRNARVEAGEDAGGDVSAIRLTRPAPRGFRRRANDRNR